MVVSSRESRPRCLVIPAASILAFLAACAGTAVEPRQPLAQSSPPPASTVPPIESVPPPEGPEGVGGGDEFPIYREPHRPITPGTFNSQLTPEARERGNDAARADAAKPRFKGWVGDIYVGADPDPKHVPIFPCEKQLVTLIGRPEDENALRASPHWFDHPSYLPPGTSEWTYPYGQACSSEPAFDIERHYLINGGGNMIIVRSWRRFFPQDFSRDRVQSGSVAGRPSVIIPPFTPEGAGDTHVIIREEKGTIRISGFGMPLSEIQKVGEALVADLA
jgi:hypothetical protein